jgi:hypothetical protein
MYSHSCESFQKLANNLTGDSLEIKPQKTVVGQLLETTPNPHWISGWVLVLMPVIFKKIKSSTWF